MNSTGRPGRPTKGRRIHESWLPRNRLPASQANRTRRVMAVLPPSCVSHCERRRLATVPAKAMISTWASRMASCVRSDVAEGSAVSGGAFQTMKAMSGLNAPRIAAERLPLVRIAVKHWRNVMFKPSNGASMALMRMLPKVVIRMMRGNLRAV